MQQTDFKFNLGAELLEEGVRFRVWAPRCQQVDVALEDGRVFSLEKEDNGYFSAIAPELKAGTLYRFQLDGDKQFPDPCSRFQPQGPHGPSQVMDPNTYVWQDSEWPGVSMQGQVIYELHVGTFTPEGTYAAAAQQIAELKKFGITVIELMPLAEFPGRFNWGYDGVNLFAPHRFYGTPDDLKKFIDSAHAQGMAVILDVVYNHLGPDGNYIKEFTDFFFSDKKNEWGESIRFDGQQSKEVREFFIQNACYWIQEFHFDGLRLDATQDIHDSSEVHILAELSDRTRASAPGRKIILIAENEPQQVRLIQAREKNGFGLDAVWNDDFHHSAQVALTGRREAYFTDYRGSAQELLSAAKHGFLYQGQRYDWQNQPRGTRVADEPGCAFVFYLQNHDQIANSLHGERIHGLTSPAKYRALMALMLLTAETPLFFMGQEFAASQPFLFFADHEESLARKVHEGRLKFLAQFESLGTPEAAEKILDPSDMQTFFKCKLDFSERLTHSDIYNFHEDLLKLRREDSVIAAQNRKGIDGAVLSREAFAMRFQKESEARLLIVNLGAECYFNPCPEPILAPPPNKKWELVWSSDRVRYGGPGVRDACLEKGWRLPAESAVFYV
jgi:maltooligosyltrehalose trehalohydrolase